MIRQAFIDYTERINRVHNLIRMQHTGNLTELAARLHVSRRTIGNYLGELKSLGADVAYSREKESYYYRNDFMLYVSFEVRIDGEVVSQI